MHLTMKIKFGLPCSDEVRDNVKTNIYSTTLRISRRCSTCCCWSACSHTSATSRTARHVMTCAVMPLYATSLLHAAQNVLCYVDTRQGIESFQFSESCVTIQRIFREHTLLKHFNKYHEGKEVSYISCFTHGTQNHVKKLQAHMLTFFNRKRLSPSRQAD